MLTDFERRLSESMHELTPEPPNDYKQAATTAPRWVTAEYPDRSTAVSIELDLARSAHRWTGRASLGRSARTLAILGSAAAVAAIVAGVTWVGASSNSTHAGQASTPVGHLPSRTLAFSVRADSGMHIAAATTLGTGEQSADLVDATRSTHLQLDVFARGVDDDAVIQRLAHGEHVAGLRPVLVAGRHGYGGTLPGSTSTLVAWPYAADSWAMIVSQDSSPSVADTVRTGEAVNFAGTTIIRTPIRIRTTPAGMHLAYVNSAYAVLTANPPVENDHSWHTEVGYAPSGKGNGIEISTTTLKKGTLATSGADEPIAVNAHAGTWDPKLHAVCFTDATNSVSICAQENQIPTTAPLTMSRQHLLRVAESITLATRPAEQTSWFNASTALP